MHIILYMYVFSAELDRDSFGLRETEEPALIHGHEVRGCLSSACLDPRHGRCGNVVCSSFLARSLEYSLEVPWCGEKTVCTVLGWKYRSSKIHAAQNFGKGISNKSGLMEQGHKLLESMHELMGNLVIEKHQVWHFTHRLELKRNKAPGKLSVAAKSTLTTCDADKENIQTFKTDTPYTQPVNGNCYRSLPAGRFSAYVSCRGTSIAASST